MKDTDGLVELEVPMEEETVAFLEGLSAKLSLNSGSHVKIDEIVRAAIGFLIKSGADMRGCCNEDDVLEAIEKARRSL